MTIKTKFSKFIPNSSGNITILSAIALPVLLLIVGSAVSLSDANNKKSKLQSHADIMSLTMAKQKLELTGVNARAYFHEYMSSEMSSNDDCTFKMKKRKKRGFAEATVRCSGETPSFLGGFLDQKTLPYSVTSTAVMQTDDNIYEVAFVFDISDSMEGQEIEELKASLNTISESSLFDSEASRVSFIPFANTVRLSTKLENFVTPGVGYDDAGGVYNGCFDRDATDPNIDLRSNPSFSLVVNALSSGRGVCPDESMTAVFHEKVTEWAIKDLVSNIETSFGTGLSDALVWGFRSLDPGLRGILSTNSAYPLSVGTSSKHIIMMTDGRPYDRPWSGPGGGAVTQQLSLDRFEDVCAQLPFEANGINFHLINYNNKKLTSEHIQVFEGCVRGDGEFYDVQTGDLTAVIRDITNKVTALRLSQ